MENKKTLSILQEIYEEMRSMSEENLYDFLFEKSQTFRNVIAKKKVEFVLSFYLEENNDCFSSSSLLTDYIYKQVDINLNEENISLKEGLSSWTTIAA